MFDVVAGTDEALVEADIAARADEIVGVVELIWLLGLIGLLGLMRLVGLFGPSLNFMT